MFRPLTMTSLIADDPDKARSRILAAFRCARCSRQDAAVLMGVSKRSLARWIVALEMTEKLSLLEAKAIRDGWHHGRVGGHPLGTKNRPREAPPTKRKRAA
jgi:hypothetical protein